MAVKKAPCKLERFFKINAARSNQAAQGAFVPIERRLPPGASRSGSNPGADLLASSDETWHEGGELGAVLGLLLAGIETIATAGYSAGRYAF